MDWSLPKPDAPTPLTGTSVSCNLRVISTVKLVTISVTIVVITVWVIQRPWESTYWHSNFIQWLYKNNALVKTNRFNNLFRFCRSMDVEEQTCSLSVQYTLSDWRSLGPESGPRIHVPDSSSLKFASAPNAGKCMEYVNRPQERILILRPLE